MPCIGQVSFLLDISLRNEVLYEGVSMPCIGQVSFLRGRPTREGWLDTFCVNALYRASLISTQKIRMQFRYV